MYLTKIIIICSLLIFSCNKSPTEPCYNITCWDCSFACSEEQCPGRINNFPVIWDCDFDGVLDNYNDYQNNGSITSIVFLDNINLGSEGDLIGAFVNEELRGIAAPIEIPFGPYEGTYQFLMLIYSNAASGESIDLQFYDNETDTLYDIIETYQFISDMMEGDVIEPIVFTVEQN